MTKVMSEKNLLCDLATHNPFVPVSLAFFQDDSYLYTVYKLKGAGHNSPKALFWGPDIVCVPFMLFQL